jgi:hypothetical protein
MNGKPDMSIRNLHPDTSGAHTHPEDANGMDLLALALTFEPLSPPPDVEARILQRLLGRIAQAPVAEDDATSPALTLRVGEGSWMAMAPAVDYKVLHEVGEQVSMLVRMQAGACMPPHDHVGTEECYVISGDIWLSGVHLLAGDFQLADQRMSHHDIRSDTGCLLHIRSHKMVGQGAHA